MICARFESRRGPAAAPSRRVGMTLMDLLLTITLAAILGSIGAPILLPALVEFRLTAASEELLGAVDYARSRAVVAGSQTRVTFDVDQETVLVEELDTAIDLGGGPVFDLGLGPVLDLGLGPDLAQLEVETYRALEHPLDRGRDYLVRFSSGGWSGAVDLVSADFGGGVVVVFDARGVPSAGGNVRLESSGKTVDLVLEPLSGRMGP